MRSSRGLSTSGSSRSKEERESEAPERDRKAAARDIDADDRDDEAERRELREADQRVVDEEQRQLALDRHRVAVEAKESTLERAAAVDRRHAASDRRQSAQDRQDAAKERSAAASDGLAEQKAGIELTSQNERLRDLDALKDRFVLMVAHELRTPLTAIRGFLEIVLGEQPGPLNDEQKRFLGVVDLNSEQLLRVIDDLLVIGKAGAGHLGLEMGEVDLVSLLEGCITAATPAAAAKHVALRLRADQVPPITADGGRLTQAVGNIISNAIKFTHDGDVDIRLHTQGDRAIIEVLDTGTGVPKSEVDHLFVPFFRASTATTQAIPGTGLGLSIAKELVEAHGGTITVESQEGSGTSFRVELPTHGVEPPR